MKKEDEGELWECRVERDLCIPIELSVKVQEFCCLQSPHDQVILLAF